MLPTYEHDHANTPGNISKARDLSDKYVLSPAQEQTLAQVVNKYYTTLKLHQFHKYEVEWNATHLEFSFDGINLMTLARHGNKSANELDVIGNKPTYLEIGVFVNNTVHTKSDDYDFRGPNCPALIIDYWHIYYWTNVSMVNMIGELSDNPKGATEICADIVSKINPIMSSKQKLFFRVH